MHRNNVSVSNYYVETLLSKDDLVLLQETWLYKEEIPLLNQFNSHYYGTGEAILSTSDGPHIGRPYGGVAILWQKNIDRSVTVMKYDVDWIVGVNIKSMDGRNITILCVYLPHCSPQNEEDFILKLNIINDIITESNRGNFIVAGVFNADVGCRVSSFGRILIDFCEDCDLSLSSLKGLPGNTYTFVSDIDHSCSWLDHVVSCPSVEDCITHLAIDYDLCSDDHLPIYFHINIDIMTQVVTNIPIIKSIKWDKLSPFQRYGYTVASYHILAAIKIPEYAHYYNSNAMNYSHIMLRNIDIYYNDIVHSMRSSGKPLIEVTPKRGGRSRPGWNS